MIKRDGRHLGEIFIEQGRDLLGLRKITMSGAHFDAVATRVARHPIDFDVIDIDQIEIDALASER